MLEKLNYRTNSRLDFNGRLINGQGLGQISRCRYGLFHASYNACEMIAIYNALIRKGYQGHKFADICREMYPRTWALWGLFGSNVYTTFLYFRRHGIPYQVFYKRDDFFRELPEHRVGIISFWNGKNPFDGIHTVCVEKTYTGYLVYNRYNNRDYPYQYLTPDEVVDKCRFMTGTVLLNQQ